MDLFLAPFLAGVVLVEAGEVAIVALVQREVLFGAKPGLADLGEHQVERALRALQHRGEGDIELEPLRHQLAACVLRFRDALLG